MESIKIGQSPTPTIEAKAQAEPVIPVGMTPCGACEYSSAEGGELHCRRYPPTVFFNPNATPPGPEVLFPGVKQNWYCGEGKP